MTGAFPRILLHNAETADLARWLTTALPNADFRECDSYRALPALIDSYRPDIVYTVRFDGTPGAKPSLYDLVHHMI